MRLFQHWNVAGPRACAAYPNAASHCAAPDGITSCSAGPQPAKDILPLAAPPRSLSQLLAPRRYYREYVGPTYQANDGAQDRDWYTETANSPGNGRTAMPWINDPCGTGYQAVCEYPPSHFICSPPPSPPPAPPPSPPPAPPPRQLTWLNPRTNVTYVLDTSYRTFNAANNVCKQTADSTLVTYWTAQDQVSVASTVPSC